MRLKLNQMVKSTEAQLSGDELEAFRKLSQADKRDVVIKVSENAVDAEIIDYFKQLNSENEPSDYQWVVGHLCRKPELKKPPRRWLFRPKGKA